MLTVVQCWDDGVSTDIRLVEMLRRYQARATFNLNAGLYGKARRFGWMHGDMPVQRLGWDELPRIYEGFTIANHSLTHPRLDQMERDAALREIVEGRERLRQAFGQPVLGFAYPFGTYTQETMVLVGAAGHIYARTGHSGCFSFPPQDPMVFHPCCHFLAYDFWSQYETAKQCGVFYFWGHSYEMTSEAMWSAFEEALKRIHNDPEACWGDLPDLFDS